MTAATAATLYGLWAWASSFVHEGVRYWTIRDDALISMTYARNLADGQGLIWGGEAVEGYTNFGWTLWMALLHALGFGDRTAPLAVMVTSALLIGLSSWLAHRLAVRLFDSRWIGLVAGALVLFCYPLVYWSMTGMEVSALTAATLAACLLAIRIDDLPSRRDPVLLCLVLAVGVLIRTDFVLAAGIVGGWLLWRRRRVAPLLTAAGTLAAHTAFRIIYYGDPLPNTYYLKMTGESLISRVSEGFTAMVDIAPTLLVPGFAAVVALRAVQRAQHWLLLVLVFAGQVGYSVWVGGDVWEWYGFTNRYLTIALPGVLVLATGAAVAVERTNLFRPALAAAAVGLVVLVGSFGPTLARWAPSVGPTVTDYQQERWALDFRDATEPGTSVTVTWAGAIPYFSHRPGVDLLGKMDPTVAHGPVRPDADHLPRGHRKWNYDHSIGMVQPDVVPWIWQRTDRVCEQMSSWGYVEQGSGFVRDGLAVDLPALWRPAPVGC